MKWLRFSYKDIYQSVNNNGNINSYQKLNIYFTSDIVLGALHTFSLNPQKKKKTFYFF